MKKLIAILLVCLLLTACNATTENRNSGNEKETTTQTTPSNSETTEAIETTAATEATTPPERYGTVTFEHHFDGPGEYAIISCHAEDNALLWQFKTDIYEISQLNVLIHIGQYKNLYYYIEAGAVIALDVTNGAEVWRNEAFGGSPLDNCTFIDEDGTIYLSGYFGPHLFVVDMHGSTLLKMESVSDKYYWPDKLEIDLEQGIAAIYMSAGYEGDIGSEDPGPVEVRLP